MAETVAICISLRILDSAAFQRAAVARFLKAEPNGDAAGEFGEPGDPHLVNCALELFYPETTLAALGCEVVGTGGGISLT